MKITKPTLLLDVNKCKKNIQNMFSKAQLHHVEFRPHFKTHQSLEIGRWFKEIGVNKITVSSLEMATYFAEEWNDITVAFPVNILEIETINTLAQKIKLNLLIESKETALYLNKNLKYKVDFFIKINVGNNRTGLVYSDVESIESILESTKDSTFLNFKGYLGHAGQTYACKGESEVLEAHQKSKSKLMRLKDVFKTRYPDLIISYGDTPSCSLANDFSGIDEIRPGNFVFYDLMQYQIGACITDQISVAMACPIVAIHKDRNEIVVYGGGIHFSKDRITDENNNVIYGKVVKQEGNGWSDLIPKMIVRGLSQEHGVVKVPDSEIDSYKIGDLLIILPIHSCMTANLMKSYLTTENDKISMFNPHI
ncbi:alanine racemase [Flavobacteriaceae bacterium AH-315-B10]|nr:alanine racemase [Flavobacteriaceae bacterium AH-315-B10]